ncbi:helix-turn-helix transcriptional regulator [Streptomyces sp. DSM 44915]|uniref:Helix-turn-helix transcriptional regulator n=1 Tax=Streptomyces chisholmiae TaxID=3075540 RepID=A0ABU2JTK0_9ACTN|nr:helix-turn-helix transcriptional regulator [Streptomyces sp. DSM 44915]MDT0268315.1 helix-turn-helix transcriptional regulator [Streptomyces sp. DSM 44915]
MSYADLGERIGVDAKTVERWVSRGTTPYPRHTHAAARALGADREYLWPDRNYRQTTGNCDEVLALYPNHGAVPAGLWGDLIASADNLLDIAVSCGLSLLEVVPDLVELVTKRAQVGVRVRIALPEPDAASSPVAAARAALAEESLAPLHQVRGVRLCGHDGLTNEVIRADETALVMPPVDGCTRLSSPVMHLRRLDGASTLVGVYLTGMEHVFATAAPKRARVLEMAQ